MPLLELSYQSIGALIGFVHDEVREMFIVELTLGSRYTSTKDETGVMDDGVYQFAKQR